MLSDESASVCFPTDSTVRSSVLQPVSCFQHMGCRCLMRSRCLGFGTVAERCFMMRPALRLPQVIDASAASGEELRNSVTRL